MGDSSVPVSAPTQREAVAIEGREPPVAAIDTRGAWAEFASGDGVGPVSFSLAPGERMLVLGPSGSGKSTLLRMLHGAVPHAIAAETGGSVRLVGRDVGAVTVAGLADVLGVVAQDPESGVCLPDVDDEVAFPLENLSVDPASIGPSVDAALEMAGARHLAGRRTGELSGGELQRIALAAAVAATPEVLLLDEPTSMLDAEGIDAVRAAIDSACVTTGASCVLVEHRLDELAGDAGIEALPNRWLVIGRDGRVRFDGPARELKAETARELIRDGCWVPLELELPALLGASDAAGLADRLRSLASTEAAAGDSGEDVGGASRAGAAAGVAAGGTFRRPTAALRAASVSVARGPRRARATVVAGVDLELRTGEVVALVGANGTGKSSLLACLAGLERPAAGTVTGPRAGMVFQHPEHQFAATTVRAELAHGLPTGQHTDARVDEQLRRFDLDDLADRQPHRLSGGQQRRVSLAAMLLHDRAFLLADEPTFGLDRRAQIGAMRALVAAAEEGRGVCFSSHDLRAVAAYADRVVVLGEGRVLADTTPARLVRDHRLLERARLRLPRLLRWLAEPGGVLGERDPDASNGVPRILRALDDLALALAGDAA
ncbi:hypothetical protein GCM10011490_01200 [Pseudoclavibacter endophyticus]|nr:ABC transporter ATP-binding protein [Pseudoclavibacter endophyticus]GGA55136.1 hypothetical protein GCM10011490_01200 [Pseudoclavibacter endophyticus]